MGNLSQMHHHGTKVACPCHAADCKPGRWIRLDLDDLIELCGDHYDLWNREPTCVHCGSTGHYLGSAGSVFVPHRDTTDEATRRRAFFQAIGFSKRDIARIRAMAVGAGQDRVPPARANLDVPYRVSLCAPGHEDRMSAKPFGE